MPSIQLESDFYLLDQTLNVGLTAWIQTQHSRVIRFLTSTAEGYDESIAFKILTDTCILQEGDSNFGFLGGEKQNTLVLLPMMQV
ncbi:hypothetical protein PAL_GLEAN10019841 [Pteropus alecto]|uniref:Uncharacterized protein n=1 Tax=Pteropus alecto TaxID=9402 RepID=L5JS55_PTEAL|nr:hypothetical protein PAL_GLEAN10019841 [Pteropus alecto]